MTKLLSQGESGRALKRWVVFFQGGLGSRVHGMASPSRDADFPRCRVERQVCVDRGSGVGGAAEAPRKGKHVHAVPNSLQVFLTVGSTALPPRHLFP